MHILLYERLGSVRLRHVVPISTCWWRSKCLQTVNYHCESREESAEQFAVGGEMAFWRHELSVQTEAYSAGKWFCV